MTPDTREALLADLETIFRDADRQWSDARPQVLARLKTARQDALKCLEESLDETKSGVTAAKLLSDAQDAIIQALFDFSATALFPTANPSVAERIAVVATGGYGRGLLAPGSDIDLLFLFPYRPTPWTESVVETMLYMLWDLGLKVGHAARTIDECVRLGRDDMTIRTALLECRPIAGDEPLAESLIQRFDQAVVRGTAKKFIAAKLEERDERHRRQGRSRYLVEPNVKEGKGGLRDLNTLFWIAKYVYRVPEVEDLLQHSVFSEKELRLFQKCEDFLWSVRCHLHLITGRAEERLSFENQREIAQRLGYGTRPGLSDVERFMKHYFLVAKDVGDLTRILCAALEAQHMVPITGLSRIVRQLTGTATRTLSEEFAEELGRIVLTDPDAFRNDPVNMLRIFKLASDNDLQLHPETAHELRRSLRLIDAGVRTDAEANAIFMELLTEAPDQGTILRLMNETGVLGAFVPDFGKVVAMMQFNMYHHYTVDEHLIRTLSILSDIDRGVARDDHPLASQLMGTIHNRRALYVAVFLHDIAKGRPRDHSIEGAKIARRLCPRFGLSAAETDLVSWLITEHLTMSITAQSRDLSDPKTVADFAEKMQSFERLKLLEILTEADIDAVGTNVWNGWKSQLLSTLFDATESLLVATSTRRPRSNRVEGAKSAFATTATWLGEEGRKSYIASQTPDYWLRTSPEDAAYHAELVLQKDGPAVRSRCRMRADRAVTEMTLVAPDTPELLSVVGAACAGLQANIVSADIFTTQDGLALDVFSLTPLSEDARDEEQRVKRITDMIRNGLSGERDLPRAIDRRPRALKQRAFHHATDVIIANDWSERHTAIEISGLDRPGLFRDLADALITLNLDVRSAQLATFGERVVDVFYVTGPGGAQVTDESAMALIVEKLTAAFDRKQDVPRPARTAA